MEKYSCNVYIILWCLYLLQGTLYMSGGTVSRILLALLFVLSFYYFLIVILKFKQPKVLRVLTWLIFFWSIYGILNIIVGNGAEFKVPSFYYLKTIYGSLLPIYAFYYYTKQGYLNITTLKRWILVFLAVAIIQFYESQNMVLEALSSDGAMSDEATNNAGYIMLSLLPLVPLLNQKPLLQYSVLAICMIFVLIGMKRGAIIAGTISSIWFLLYSFKGGGGSGKHILRIVLTITLVAGAIYAVQYMLLNSEYFNYRLEKTLSGDSSERDVIYSQYSVYFWEQTSIVSLLFGGGADTTLREFGEFAHNDWIEIAINNGVIVLLLYLIYWISLYKTMRLLKKKNRNYYLIISMFFIIYFMKSLFSMSYNGITIYSSSALGYALASLYNKEMIDI